MIKALDHITINVKDLDKTLAFYGQLLELPALPPVETDTQKVYYFGLPGGTKLELIHYYRDTGIDDGNEIATGKCRHFAFEVDDIKEIERRLADAGYSFHLPISYNADFSCTCGLVLDPNGFELEFVER